MGKIEKEKFGYSIKIVNDRIEDTYKGEPAYYIKDKLATKEEYEAFMKERDK